MKAIILLTVSNIFMNLAWYGHLKFRNRALWLVILASWGLALFEYIFQVPANRIGSEQWSVPQLKILQECITLVVFMLMAFVLFDSPLKWNYCVSYGLVVGGGVLRVQVLINSPLSRDSALPPKRERAQLHK
ncbi:MAG TPA: DMT family protein [Chthoniobacterales bacterium]|nr:DMT family protein [Chthoniobacterales bacterium]